MNKIAFDFKKGWVFSPKADVICFLCPFIAALIFDGTDYEQQHWLGFFLVKIMFAGHIFTSHIPIFATDSIQKRLKSKLLIVPSLFILFYFAANLVSFQSFANVLSLTILIHIYIQHMAWLKLSQSEVGEEKRKWEKRFMLTLIGVPTTLWLLYQLPTTPHYLYTFTATSFLPRLDFFTPTVLSLFSGMAVLLSIILASEKVGNRIHINVGRLMFFLSTCLWMCYGLFFSKTASFFLFYLNIAHGCAYMAYISQGWPKHVKENGAWLAENRIPKVLTLSIIAGGVWMTLLYTTTKYLPSQFIFLPWLPLIIHFAFDSIIWKRTKTAAVPVASEFI